jgi:hypothetical protein
MSETVTLGDRSFDLRPPTLGQLRRVLDALEAMNGAAGGALIAAAAEIVAAGLAPAHPGLTADALLDLEAGIDELNAAVVAVLRTAGLRPLETPAGEAQPVAGEASAPNSAPSTPRSPPAAAGTTATSTG